MEAAAVAGAEAATQRCSWRACGENECVWAMLLLEVDVRSDERETGREKGIAADAPVPAAAFGAVDGRSHDEEEDNNASSSKTSSAFLPRARGRTREEKKETVSLRLRLREEEEKSSRAGF